MLALAAVSCRADDLVLDVTKAKQVGDILQFENAVYPMVLKGYSIMKREPDGLRIAHASGISKVPYELLPAALTKDEPFDPAVALRYREEQRARQIKTDHAVLAAQSKPAPPPAAKTESVAKGAKKTEEARAAEAAYEAEKKAAWNRMIKCEDFVAREINTRTNRKVIENLSLYKGSYDKVAYVRIPEGWWPRNPIEDPDARFSFAAQDAVKLWHELKNAYGF